MKATIYHRLHWSEPESTETDPLNIRLETVGDSCTTCKTPHLKFRDDLSIKEYGISGMCQTCQDKTFGI